MDKNIVLMTTPNKWGYVVNISSPKIEPLYDYFKKRVKSPNWPISDEQRGCFEKIIVNLCCSGAIYVKDWVKNHCKFSAWNSRRWFEYRGDTIPVNNDQNVLYSDVQNEIALINKALFWKLEGGVISSDDMEVIERIELTDPALANIVLERMSNNFCKKIVDEVQNARGNVADNEIIKALYNLYCAAGYKDTVTMDKETAIGLYDYFNRQKAEIERYKNAFKQVEWERDTFSAACTELHGALRNAKAEVIKEFAERLKKISSSCVTSANGREIYETKIYTINATTFDNLVKEKAGDNK